MRQLPVVEPFKTHAFRIGNGWLAPKEWRDPQLISVEQSGAGLRDLLAEYRLVGYHGTRLLPHEMTDIREVTGLEILTEDLGQREVEGVRRHCPGAFDGDDPTEYVSAVS